MQKRSHCKRNCQLPLKLATSGLLLMLFGCGEASLQSELDNYRERIERTLGADTAPAAKQVLPHPPSSNDLAREVPPLSISLWQFLKASDCELQTLIGQRNSSLGKVIAHSQRLAYEASLINALESCAELQDDDPELQQLLTSAAATKRQQLKDIAWNGLFAGIELQAALSPSSPLLPWRESDRALIQAKQSLQILQAVLSNLLHANDAHLGLPPIDLKQLEKALQTLYFSQAFGSLLQSQRLLISQLDRVSKLLKQQTDTYPICPQGRPTPKARTLRNILFKYYSQSIQLYLATINREGDELNHSFERLVDIFPSSPILDSWYSHYHSWNFRLKRASKDHALVWQKLLHQCQLSP